MTGHVSNETNEDVRMYTCRIYSSRDLDTLLHKVEGELNKHWKNAGLYTLATKDLRNVRIALRSQLTSES